MPCAGAASVLLIEGLGQQNYGNLNWGDGLITDAATIAQKKLSDPNPFFQQLLTKPYRKQVIVAVHVYPPSISKVRRLSCRQLQAELLCTSLGPH